MPSWQSPAQAREVIRTTRAVLAPAPIPPRLCCVGSQAALAAELEDYGAAQLSPSARQSARAVDAVDIDTAAGSPTRQSQDNHVSCVGLPDQAAAITTSC